MAFTPSKVMQGHRFDTNGKLICDFLSVINANLHLISHSFQVIADYWTNFGFRQGVPLFNVHVLVELLNSTVKFVVKQLETSLVQCNRRFDILHR